MISVKCDHDEENVVLASLAVNAVEHALQCTEQPAHAGLSVVLTTDEELQRLNREHRGIDAPTDVLSFPAGEGAAEEGEIYLGDILISVPRAAAQAGEGRHTLQQEVELLVVHAVLHLLGYDHDDEGEKARMWEAQSRILASLGNPLSPD